MLTEIKYIGRKGLDRGYSALICREHNIREMATYVYQLEEIECPVCVAKADHEHQRQQERAWMLAEAAAQRGHPSVCLCHACAPWEAEYDRIQAEELERLFLAEIESPDYCDHQTLEIFGCDRSACPHPGCLEEQAKEPPF